jgi:hypothetical protein
MKVRGRVSRLFYGSPRECSGVHVARQGQGGSEVCSSPVRQRSQRMACSPGRTATASLARQDVLRPSFHRSTHAFSPRCSRKAPITRPLVSASLSALSLPHFSSPRIPPPPMPPSKSAIVLTQNTPKTGIATQKKTNRQTYSPGKALVVYDIRRHVLPTAPSPTTTPKWSVVWPYIFGYA